MLLTASDKRFFGTQRTQLMAENDVHKQRTYHA